MYPPDLGEHGAIAQTKAQTEEPEAGLKKGQRTQAEQGWVESGTVVERGRAVGAGVGRQQMTKQAGYSQMGMCTRGKGRGMVLLQQFLPSISYLAIKGKHC